MFDFEKIFIGTFCLFICSFMIYLSVALWGTLMWKKHTDNYYILYRGRYYYVCQEIEWSEDIQVSWHNNYQEAIKARNEIMNESDQNNEK